MSHVLGAPLTPLRIVCAALLLVQEPTDLAWRVLASGAHAFVAVGDEVIEPCQALLAGLEPPLPAGESAVAGLGALVAAAAQPGLRADLGLDARSRVVVIVCEGPTGV